MSCARRLSLAPSAGLPWPGSCHRCSGRPRVDAGRRLRAARFCPDRFHTVARDVFPPRSVLGRAQVPLASLLDHSRWGPASEPAGSFKHRDLPSPRGVCRTVIFPPVICPPAVERRKPRNGVFLLHTVPSCLPVGNGALVFRQRKRGVAFAGSETVEGGGGGHGYASPGLHPRELLPLGGKHGCDLGP